MPRSFPHFSTIEPETFVENRAFANSDAGGAAYTDSAIDQGHRAVMELLHAEKA